MQVKIGDFGLACSDSIDKSMQETSSSQSNSPTQGEI